MKPKRKTLNPSLPGSTTTFTTNGKCYCQKVGTPPQNKKLISCYRCGTEYHQICMELLIKEKIFECPSCILEYYDPLSKVIDFLIKPAILQETPDPLSGYTLANSIYFQKIKDRSIDPSDLEIQIRCIKLDSIYTFQNRYPDQCTWYWGKMNLESFTPLSVNSSKKLRKDAKVNIKFRDIVENPTITQTRLLRCEFKNILDNKNSKKLDKPKYIFSVVLIKKLKPEDLVSQIKKSAVVSSKYYQDLWSVNNIDISSIRGSASTSNKIKVDRNCKFSNLPLKTAGRGNECTHIQAFNLLSMVSCMNINGDRTWLCPICKIRCYHLKYDVKLQEAIDQANSEQIMLNANGDFEYTTKMKKMPALFPQDTVIDVDLEPTPWENMKYTAGDLMQSQGQGLSQEELLELSALWADKEVMENLIELMRQLRPVLQF